MLGPLTELTDRNLNLQMCSPLFAAKNNFNSLFLLLVRRPGSLEVLGLLVYALTTSGLTNLLFETLLARCPDSAVSVYLTIRTITDET